MIKYKLKCKNCEKNFDSWFSSSLEFEKLKNKKFLNCHFCGSKKIDKNLIAPNILNSVSNIEKKALNKKITALQQQKKPKRNLRECIKKTN